MTVKDLERLYDYGYWANKKLLAVVAQLTPEQFTQTVAGSYGSVRNMLVHIAPNGDGSIGAADAQSWRRKFTDEELPQLLKSSIRFEPFEIRRKPDVGL